MYEQKRIAERIQILKTRAINSARLECHPYKVDVAGSIPASPTKMHCRCVSICSLIIWCSFKAAVAQLAERDICNIQVGWVRFPPVALFLMYYNGTVAQPGSST